MSKKVLVALGLVAAIIILLVLYFFYAGGPPSPGPEKPKEPAAKTQAPPEPQEKAAPALTPAPAPPPPPSPAPQEPPQPVPSPEKPLTKPEAAPPPAKETVLPPLEPKEKYGLLAGSYRKYPDANKMMKKLKKQDLPAFIRRDKGRYQVWVGPFSTPEEAVAAAKSLKAKSKISPKIEKLIIPVPK